MDVFPFGVIVGACFAGLVFIALGALMVVLFRWIIRDPLAQLRYGKRRWGVDYSILITDREKYASSARLRARVGMVPAILFLIA